MKGLFFLDFFSTPEENILRLNGNQPGKILFFGGNYSTDAITAEATDYWDAVCIVEELGDVNSR